MYKLTTLIATVVLSFNLLAAEPVLSPNAPIDMPIGSKVEELDKIHAAMLPYTEEARKTYPAAKAKYQKGLPRGEHFFLTTRLHDDTGKEEQVFIAVTSIDNGIVHGIIFSQLEIVSGFRYKQEYLFPETKIIDWLITKPDGSEEGNVVGKFLDTYNSR